MCPRCPRCGGYLYQDQDGPACLQCARPLFRPEPLPYVRGDESGSLRISREGRREAGQRQKHLPFTHAELTEARWLREAGIPMNAIARKLGRDATSLRNRLEKVSV